MKTGVRRNRRVATRTMVEKWATQIAHRYFGIVGGEDCNYTCCSAHTTGDALYSFSTPIAAYKNGRFVYNAVKYSRTTSKLQFYVRGAIKATGIPFDVADESAVRKAM